MEKDKKYNIVLGIMIFLFILVVGVAIAWGLGIIGLKDNNLKENANINNVIEDNSEVNIKEENNDKFPKEVDINSSEVKDIINFINAKIKFMTPSDNYKDELTDDKVIEAAMLFYLNDYPEKGGDEYIYGKDLDNVINKYFGIQNIEYGDLESGYVYDREKQRYEQPLWGTTHMKIITKLEYINKDTIYIYLDDVNKVLYDVTEDTYTQDMVENKLVVTIKIEENNSFIITNYGYYK